MDSSPRSVQKYSDLCALYDNSPGFIATSTGPDHTFTYANAAYEAFVGRTGLLGKTVAGALPEIVSQGLVEVLDDAFRTGKPYIGTDVEMTFRNNGAAQPIRRYCDFVYQPVFASNGSVTGIFCEGYDVTQRHEIESKMATLQDELFHLSRVNAMGEMAATLAHELSQPLASIANFAAAGERYLDAQDFDSRELARESIKSIAEIVERAGQIIRSLRDQTAQRQTRKTEFELTSAIAECIKLISAGTHKDLKIVDRSREPIKVNANRIQIQQVIINLLSNAADAAFDGDQNEIEICAFEEQELINVCVKDHGRGVAALASEALFLPNESTKTSGMGIGLSVSRSIIEAHGGQIWLKKTGPKGSEFCFTLPNAKMEKSELVCAPES
jgi:two-component system sensor kinase FixL